MDIGVPYRNYGKIDIRAAVDLVNRLPEEAWMRNTFRQEAMADKSHSATRTIILKHEWTRWENPWAVNGMEDLVRKWAAEKQIDPAPFMPTLERETDIGAIYLFPEWTEYEAVIAPVVEQAVAFVRTPTGLVTRVALVCMPGGANIAPHVDGQPMAIKAHRLHIPLLSPVGVEYRIGPQKFKMKVGHVYDFNNRMRHSVTHKGKLPRVNLFVDYYPNPLPYVPRMLVGQTAHLARRAIRSITH
jgi:hypothetical protein